MKADGTGYTLIEDNEIAAAPEWFYVEAGKTGDKPQAASQDFVVAPNSPANVEWAIHYLKNNAPKSIDGKGGESTTLQVAGVLKDHGIGEAVAVELMAEHYTSRQSATRYGTLGMARAKTISPSRFTTHMNI
jgi:hypothetical protein